MKRLASAGPALAVLAALLGALALALAAAGQAPPPSQTTAALPPTADPGAAVANLERALRAVSTLQARFEQLHYSMTVSTPLRERGELFLRKPDEMRWEYRDPQPKVFLYKGGVLEMYLPEEKQLTRSPVPEEALRSDIFGILLGTASIRETYEVEANPFPTDAVRVAQVRLIPKTEGEFSHILLEIDETTWLLRRAIFLEWAGNKREFVFSRMKTGVRLPAGTFTLKVPPGTEIIDDAGAGLGRGQNL